MLDPSDKARDTGPTAEGLSRPLARDSPGVASLPISPTPVELAVAIGVNTEVGVALDHHRHAHSTRVKTVDSIGKPRDLGDHTIFHSLSLVAFLAWVGLGADGLSSSCYGPSEAFKTLQESHLGDFRFLAIFLALAKRG